MKKWTIKDVLKDKTRPVIILTIIFTIAINSLVNQVMTREVVSEYGITYTYHFSLGIYGVVFAIPAGLISILLVKFFLGKVKRETTSFEYKKEFKWYSIYGTVSGIIILPFLFRTFSTYASQIEVTNVWKGLFHATVTWVIPIIIAVIAAKIINKVMVRITNTNGRLIREINEGLHDGDFPESNEKQRIVKLLKKGTVSTVKGGIWRLKINDFFSTIGTAIILGILSLFSNEGGSNASGSGGGYRHSDLHQERKRLKNEANYKAEQKRKQADYSKRQFVKQANYNPKYSQSEWNRAVHDEREYQAAKKNADRL